MALLARCPGDRFGECGLWFRIQRMLSSIKDFSCTRPMQISYLGSCGRLHQPRARRDFAKLQRSKIRGKTAALSRIFYAAEACPTSEDSDPTETAEVVATDADCVA